MSTTMAGADWLTTTEAARLLGVARAHLNAQILQGEIPATRIGQQWVIQADDLQGVPRRGPRPLRPCHLTTLRWLADHDGSTVPDAVADLGTPRRTVLQRFQDLEGAGLIRRVPGPSQRDPHRAYLTAKGRARVAEDAAA